MSAERYAARLAPVDLPASRRVRLRRLHGEKAILKEDSRELHVPLTADAGPVIDQVVALLTDVVAEAEPARPWPERPVSAANRSGEPEAQPPGAARVRTLVSLVRPIAAVGAAAVTVLILATGCGASSEVAAEVAGVEYTVDDLNDYLATTDPDNSARAPREATALWLSEWAFFSAVELELAELGMAVSNEHEARAVAEMTQADPAFVPGAGGGDVTVHQRAIVLAALEWAEREAPDAPIAGPLRHLCSKHILVESQAEADAVLALLDAGEEFGFLAIELSLDPGSGSLGGDLGCVVEGSFVAPFEAAAYAAEPGEAVVAESQFGFHVIEVISSGPATPDNHPHLDAEQLAFMVEDAELAAAERAQIAVQDERQQLLTNLQETVLLSYAAEVRINERYGYWDPEQFRVVLEPLR